MYCVLVWWCHFYTAAPKYSLDTDYLEAEAGSSPIVTFTVTSDPPLAEDTMHTLRKKSDGSKTTKRFRVENNHIIFRKVRAGDSGIYTISCYNDDEVMGQEELELVVVPPLQQPAHGHGFASTTG